MRPSRGRDLVGGRISPNFESCPGGTAGLDCNDPRLQAGSPWILTLNRLLEACDRWPIDQLQRATAESGPSIAEPDLLLERLSGLEQAGA